MLERFTWFRQSAYRWKGDGITIYIDPWGVSKGKDEPGDVIFITHAHFDHFQPDEIEKVRKPGTKLVAPRDVAKSSGAMSRRCDPASPSMSPESRWRRCPPTTPTPRSSRTTPSRTK